MTKVRMHEYASTHPVPKVRMRKCACMTIGIGLVCSGGKNILLAADTRASYGVVTSNDQTAKLYDLPSNYCAAVAGTLNQCADVVAELYHRMSQVTEPEIAPELTRRCVLESYDQVFKPMADEALRNGPRITLDEYKHDKKLSPPIRRHAREVLNKIEIDVDLIVGGFYKGQPVQFVAEGGTFVGIRSEVTPGNAVIGTGSIAALNWLNYRKQNVHFGLAHSLLHLTEAKQFAETEHTVGSSRGAILLWSGAYKALDWSDEVQALTQGWWNRYGLPLSDGLENETHNESIRKMFGVPTP